MALEQTPGRVNPELVPTRVEINLNAIEQTQ